jgi:hypothetical protein
LTGYDCPPKSKRYKSRRHSNHTPVKKEHKVKNTKTSKCIHKKYSSSSESESSDESSSKSNSSAIIRSNSSYSSDTNSSDSEDSAASLLPPQTQKPPKPTPKPQKPVPMPQKPIQLPSHSSRSNSSDSENSTTSPVPPKLPTPQSPTLKPFKPPPTLILKKLNPYSNPLLLEPKTTASLDSETKTRNRMPFPPLKSSQWSTGKKILSFVSSFHFGGGTVKDPWESSKDNAEDDANPEEPVVEVSGAGD